MSILTHHQIPFQVTGGLAAHLYGGKRPLLDIDLDIPEESFELILEEVRPYLVFGPELHQGDIWKVELMTLNYEGQDIDLGGAYKTQIFNSQTGAWLDSPADFSKVRMMEISGLKIPVVDAEDLIRYKKILSRTEDLEDVQVVETWLKRRV